jgi:hypothetical protein
VSGVADVHADIDALKELADALTRFRHAEREVADRGDHEVEAARASLEDKASRWRFLLARRQADLAACQAAAASDASAGAAADCSAEASAVREAEQRLAHIRRWQQRVDEEAGAFRGASGRFRDVLDLDLPRSEQHLRAVIGGLEAARRIQVAGS